MRLQKPLWGLLLLLVAVLGTADPASASNNKGFRGYATCSTVNPDPDRHCSFGDAFGGTLIAKKGNKVRYKLCVTRTATGAKSCFSKRTRGAGKPSSIRLFNKSIVSGTGTYRLKWRVRGKGIIARATLKMLLGD